MRLTAELLTQAVQYTNPIGQREIYLRSLSLSSLEHLAIVSETTEAIDISDNALTALDHLSVMRVLQTLIMANNHINRLGSSLGNALPELNSLILSNNKLSQLKDLFPLSTLSSLQLLSLRANPVCTQPLYRMFVIHLLPSLHVLDFAKIRPREREESKALSKKGAFASFLPAIESKSESKVRAQINLLLAAISEAKTIEEINSLEQQLTNLTHQLEAA